MIELNLKTEKLLNSFISRPTSSLILVGTRDDGMVQIVDDITAKLLDTQNTKYNILQLEPETGKNISVEQVRELNKSLNNKVKSDHSIARIAVIWDFDNATHEAQNALLKLLEEPANQTLLILHATNKSGLLSTITSRCQLIPILPLTLTQALSLAKKQNKSEKDAEKAYLLSDGNSQIFINLLKGDDTEISESINIAKEFLNSNLSKRISMQKEFDTNEKINNLINMIENIASVSLKTSTKEIISTRWIKIIKETRRCRELLNRNVNTKLIYTRLCVCL